MTTYVTIIGNRKAVFTDDYIQIENLILYYDKMSNIRYNIGKSGFAFEYEGKNILIPCNSFEKDKMTPYFSKAVSLERKRKELELIKQQEEKKPLTLDDLSFENTPSNSNNINSFENNFSNNQPLQIPNINTPNIQSNSNSINFKICPVCGTKVHIKNKLCPKCGSSIKNSNIVGYYNNINYNNSNNNKKYNSNKVLETCKSTVSTIFSKLQKVPLLVYIIIGVIILLIIAGCIIGNILNNSINSVESTNESNYTETEVVSEWATEVTPITDFEYTINGDYIHLIKYVGKSKKIWVSAQYEIGNATYFTDTKMDALFEHSDDIYSIILPEGIITMDNNIFSGCEVEYLYIPKSLQSTNDNESFYDYLYNIKQIYYGGSEEDFNKLINNRNITDEVVYNSSIPNLVGSAKTYQIQIPNIENTQEDIQEETYGKTYTLKGGELGDYGKKITLNKNTDDPNDVYLYKLPKGKYLVTTEGERVQFAVVKDETTIEDSEYPEILDYVGHPYLITGNSSNVNELVKKEIKIKLKKDESIYITGNDTITVKEIVSSGTKTSQDKSKTETKKETKKEEIDPSIQARSAAVNYFSTIPWDNIFKYQYTIHYVAGLEVYEVANDDTDKWEASAPAEVQNGFGAISNGRIYMYMDKDYNLTSIFYEGPNGTEKIY